jgi:hypothetical protein
LSADEAAERRRAGARRLAREGAPPPAADQPEPAPEPESGSAPSPSPDRAPASSSSSRRKLTAPPNLSKLSARKTVLVAIALLFLLTFYRDRKSATPAGTYHVFWATGVVGLFLSLLADFAPAIAGPFAALIVLGSLTENGGAALDKLLAVISGNANANTNAGGPPGTLGPQTLPPGQTAPAAPAPTNPGGPAGTTGPQTGG